MEAQEIKVQKTLTDLSTLEDVTLVKIGSFVPVANVQDALARLNNDSEALNAVINAGLKARAAQELRTSADGWHTFKLDAEGEETSEINGPFTGQVGDSKKINNLVLSLAKSVFGFEKSMSKDQKRAAKESARDMIRNTPAIKDGLSKTAALTADEE